MGRPGKKEDRLNGFKSVTGTLFEHDCRTEPSERLPEAYDPEKPEASYCDCIPLEHRKRYGQFFTPPVIADILCDWVLEGNPKAVLDPAVGTGILMRGLLVRAPKAAAMALDRDPIVLDAARQTLDQEHVSLECCDFLTWRSPRLFDGIVANPPYLRHHDMLYDHDIFCTVGLRNGVRLSRLTNAYGLFILEICRRLIPGGRAAIIVPGEWLNANFGMPIKEFLLARGLLRCLVYFSHASLIFEDSLSTACLLFIEKPGSGACPAAMLRTVFVRDGVEGEALRGYLRGEQQAPEGICEFSLPVQRLLVEKKWNYLLQNGLPERRPGFVSLADVARTSRGIATGANSFFHLPFSEAKRRAISSEHLKPCVGRATDVKGFLFDDRDFDELSASGRPAYLACLEGRLTDSERAYVGEGEALGLPRRYLLASRSPWYTMESRCAAPVWAAVFGRNRLRFIWNKAAVHNLTTFHCVYLRGEDPEFAAALVACLNSQVVQDMSQQQQRVYGGGLRKFEPRDLLEVTVPNLEAVSRKTIKRLHDLLLRLDEAERSQVASVQAVLGEIDAAVNDAAAEATNRAEPPEESPRPIPVGRLWEQQTHHDDPGG